MPYSGNPTTSAVDEVRFLVGDTSRSSELMSTEEYQYLLVQENNSTSRAAARAADILAAKYAGEAETKQVGPLRLSYENRSNHYRALAAQLWRRATTAVVAPYVGGLSKAEKAASALDSDRVQPKFRKNTMAYPQGEAHRVGNAEEITGEAP